MRHHNSVFHDLLKQVPWGEFDRLVTAHAADARARRLTTKSQLIALLYAQFSGASSLREIEAGLNSHALRLYHQECRKFRVWAMTMETEEASHGTTQTACYPGRAARSVAGWRGCKDGVRQGWLA